jgi:cytochrome c556
MNVKSIIASVSMLVATGAAFAAEPAQQLTREQVIAETVAARAAGQLDQNEATFDQQFRSAAAASTLTRADVKAQTIAAREAGELDRNEAYDDVSYMAPRARNASVKAQLAAKTVIGNSTH